MQLPQVAVVGGDAADPPEDRAALVADLEERVRERGGYALWLGTDDEDGMTTVSGVDLYPNVLEHLANIKNLRGHPYEFYQRLGFSIIGILPDANGPGKPDIFMAKPLRSRQRKSPGPDGPGPSTSVF